jgi:predicted nucleic acid-binding protein
MKILDTNVVSELMREEPEAKVVRWVEARPLESLGVSVITLAEIDRGLKRLPEGRKREELERRFLEFIEKGFQGRVFAFDERAARLYGGNRRSGGDAEYRGFRELWDRVVESLGLRCEVSFLAIWE